MEAPCRWWKAGSRADVESGGGELDAKVFILGSQGHGLG